MYVRVPVIIEADGHDITELLILEGFERHRPFAANIKVIAKELGGITVISHHQPT